MIAIKDGYGGIIICDTPGGIDKKFLISLIFASIHAQVK